MRVLNSHTLLNIRVSQKTFEFIKDKVPFLENKMPFEFGSTDSIMKDRVAVCHDFQLKKLAEIANKKSYTFVSRDPIAEMMSVECELNAAYSECQKSKAHFVYVMAE